MVGAFALQTNLDRLLPAKADRVAGQGLPPAGVGASSQRVLPAVVGPSGSGGYRFLATQPHGTDPVTYDPCRTIHYVIHQGPAPASALPLVRQAVAAVSRASGLQFVEDGSTSEAPTEKRKAYQPDRYGERWAPVLIAWSDPQESPGLAGPVAGLGGSTPWRDTHGHLTYVTGTVRLDTPALLPATGPALAAGEVHTARVRAVVMHELGHVVGLAHVSDRRQLMFADNTGQTAFGDGDRRGLALLGRGACIPGL